MCFVSFPLFSMFSRDGESLQAVLGREPATFQGQNGWISEPRWDVCLTKLNLLSAGTEIHSKIRFFFLLYSCAKICQRCFELDVYHDTRTFALLQNAVWALRVMVSLYELILYAISWNKMNHHWLRVLSFLHEWSTMTFGVKNKKGIFFFFIVVKNVVCKCLLFKLPFHADFQNHDSSLWKPSLPPGQKFSHVFLLGRVYSSLFL